jgi:sodium-dependent dicarboxylate transporter 2/3/5
MPVTKLLKIASGPLLFVVTYFLLSYFNHAHEGKMAGIAAWVAAWWLTEAVELPVSSMLPFVLIPIMGIADSKTIAMQYMDQVIFLFMGGFMLGYALEKTNLHSRLALLILSKVGISPRRILAGIMLAAFFISMWMSNTATLMMLFAAVTAIIAKLNEQQTTHSSLGGALMIGLAYAASIGGMSTLVGTPTNMIFYSFYNSNFIGQQQIVFSNWFMLAFPIAILLLTITYWLISKHFSLHKIKVELSHSYFKEEYKKLGKAGRDEKLVGSLFVLTACLWFSRSDIMIGDFHFKGWSNLFVHKDFIQDSTIAIFMSLLLFFIPSKKEEGKPILLWTDCKKLPLGIMLLFGSGFAIAKGFELSGLSQLLASSLQVLNAENTFLIIVGTCVIITFISEFASNVASIQLALPILLSLAVSLHLPAIGLMIPATLAASLGFMLPVATAPNSIVYGSGMIQVKDMYRIGLWVNLVGIILIVFFSYFFSQAIFKF